jgi:hypothetical protein
MKAKLNQKVMTILQRSTNDKSVGEALAKAISSGSDEPVVVTDDQGNKVILRANRTPVPAR